MRGYVPPADAQEKMLQRRIEEMAKAAAFGSGARFTAFLSEREQQLALAALSRVGVSEYVLEGGYPGAERKMLCVCAGPVPPFPMTLLELVQQGAPGPQNLNHRDYLGALLGLGIKRECLGDILVDQNHAVVCVKQEMADFVVQNLRQVGRQMVTVQLWQQEALPQPGTQQAQRASVASLRLDAVLAAMLHTARAGAADIIRAGQVQVNHLAVESVHYEVQQGDVFSVRGQGKYRLESIEGRSRKKRILLEYMQY